MTGPRSAARRPQDDDESGACRVEEAVRAGNKARVRLIELPSSAGLATSSSRAAETAYPTHIAEYLLVRRRLDGRIARRYGAPLSRRSGAPGEPRKTAVTVSTKAALAVLGNGTSRPERRNARTAGERARTGDEERKTERRRTLSQGAADAESTHSRTLRDGDNRDREHRHDEGLCDPSTDHGPHVVPEGGRCMRNELENSGSLDAKFGNLG
jgi:hypothetical protein